MPPPLCLYLVMDVDSEKPAPHQTKRQKPGYLPALQFLRAQFSEEALDIAPMDIAARRSRKNQFNNPPVPSFHLFIVPFISTKLNSDLLMTSQQVNDRANRPDTAAQEQQYGNQVASRGWSG